MRRLRWQAWRAATFLVTRLFWATMSCERKAARLFDWAAGRKADAWLAANVEDYRTWKREQ